MRPRIKFHGGPADGLEQRSADKAMFLRLDFQQDPGGGRWLVAQLRGSATHFLYGAETASFGWRYIFVRAFRPATQDACGK